MTAESTASTGDAPLILVFHELVRTQPLGMPSRSVTNRVFSGSIAALVDAAVDDVDAAQRIDGWIVVGSAVGIDELFLPCSRRVLR